MTNNTFKFTKEDIAAAVESGITPDTLAQQFADMLNEVVAENSKNAEKKEKIADMQFILDAIIDFVNKWYITDDNAKVINPLIEELNDAETWVDTIDDEIIPAFESISKLNDLIEKINIDSGINYPLVGAKADTAKANCINPKITTTNTKEEIPFKIHFKDPAVMTSTNKITSDEIIDNFLTTFGLK